ncbi:MAG: RNA-dependent RNA polymerase [Bactrocera correcta trypanosomatid leishbunyavirus]|nr:MAG: RNA-dependent RNA polymerase [Bactrocera correcta trypanosomatid leishbunyavirus]
MATIMNTCLEDVNHLSDFFFEGIPILGAPRIYDAQVRQNWNYKINYDAYSSMVTVTSESLDRDVNIETLGNIKPDLKLHATALRTLPHDLVSQFLLGTTQGTEIAHLDIWERVTPKHRISPDYFYQRDDFDIVAEFKTTRGYIKNSYKDAILQYSEIIGSMRKRTLILPVAVSDCQVMIPDTIKMSRDSIASLCGLVAFGHWIIDSAIEEGMSPTYMGSRAQDRVQIPRCPLPESHDDPLIITKEMVRAWSHNNKPNPIGEALRENTIRRFKEKRTVTIPPKEEPPVQGYSCLRVGLFCPSVGKVEIAKELPFIITNPVLSHLVSKTLASPRKQHYYLTGQLGNWLLTSPNDFCHGLWGDCLSQTESLFRQRDMTKPGRELTVEYLNTLPLTIEEANSLTIRKDLHRRKTQARMCAIADQDLSLYENLLFQQCQEENIVSEDYLDISGQIQKLPYSGEAWNVHTKFWQRLVEEVNIGRYSARGRWDRFHFQKLEPYDAWLWVHGTGPDSHQFYYCIIHLDSPLTCFKDWEELGNGWWATTVVQSLKVDKISQHLNIVEKLICLRHYWQSVLSEERFRLHFTMSFLIAYDAKQATIDCLSLYRYIYMELCKEVGNRDPYKIHTKFPFRISTHLQGLIIARMQKLCRGKYGDVSETPEGQVSFRNLPSWIDWQPVPNFKVILSLSYMHYATSHPVSSGLHGKVKIMGKLLGEEVKLPENCEKIGWTSPELSEIGPHEFSVSAVKDMARFSSRRLKSVYGTYDSFMEEYTMRLKEWNFSDFSTFKKSTRIDDEDPASRAYCFEEIQRLMQRIHAPDDLVSLSPYDMWEQVVEEQKSNIKNRNVSIFVKDQQTGLREIFVLTITLRILVKSMEIFSRVVNKTLPNETLSDPTRKHGLVMRHSSLAKSSRDKLIYNTRKMDRHDRILVLRFSSSSDAKTWCQQFCMPNFGCYIWTLLEESFGSESEELRNYFMFILNEMTQKRIQVDSRVKEWFATRPDEASSDESFRLLRDTLSSANQLFDKATGGIVNRSNMMQGIPHETSSSLHASYLMITSSWLKQIIKGISTQDWSSTLILGEPIITTMVSSDDSGLLFTLPVSVETVGNSNEISEASLKQIKSLRYFLTSIGLSIEECKPMFGALVSYEKSTIFAETPVFEFNSRFYVGTSVNTAEIKFMTSQIGLGFHSDIRSRISEGLSSLSVCLKEGISQELLQTIQLMINRMHLRFLYGPGMTSETRLRLGKLSIPALGWLPLMPRGLIGFMNLELISDYLFEMKDPRAQKFAHYCNRPGWNLENTFSLYLKISSKHLSVCKEFMVSRTLIEQDIKSSSGGPLSFFTNELPEFLKVKLKIANPGTRSGMSFVDLCKIHMASCYAATFPCITVREGDEKKLTLLECISLVESGQVSSERLGQNPQIRRMLKLLFTSTEVMKTAWPRKGPYSLKLHPSGQENGISIRKALILGWTKGFGYKLLDQLSWAITIDSRIDQDFNVTLSNFGNSVLDLDSCLLGLDEKTKTVNFLCPRPSDNTLTSCYSNFLRHCWSETTSMIVSERVRLTADPHPSYNQAMSTHFNSVLREASAAAWGFSMLRGYFISRMIRIVNSWLVPIPIQNIRHISDLVCACSKSIKEQMIDLRRLIKVRSGKIFLDENLFYQCVSGYWYAGAKVQGSWTIFREKGTPILVEPRFPQEETSHEMFTIRASNLLVCVESSTKELEVRLRPTEHTLRKTQWSLDPLFGGKLNQVLVSQRLPGIEHVTYTAGLSVPGLDRGFVSELLSRLTWGGPEMSDWDFWSQLDEVSKSENYTQEERKIVTEVLVKAQSQVKPDDSSQEKDNVKIPQRSNTLDDVEDMTMELGLSADELGILYDEMVGLMELGAPEDDVEPTTELEELGVDVGAYDCMELEYGEEDFRTAIIDVRPGSTRPYPINPSTGIWSNVKIGFCKAMLKKRRKPGKLFSRLIKSTEVNIPLVKDDGSIRHITDGSRYIEEPLTLSTLDIGWDTENGYIAWCLHLSKRGIIPKDLLKQILGRRDVWRRSNPYDRGSEEFWNWERNIRRMVDVELEEGDPPISWMLLSEVDEMSEGKVGENEMLEFAESNGLHMFGLQSGGLTYSS